MSHALTVQAITVIRHAVLGRRHQMLLHANLLIDQTTLKHQDFWLSLPNGKNCSASISVQAVVEKRSGHFQTSHRYSTSLRDASQRFCRKYTPLFSTLGIDFLSSVLLSQQLFPKNFIKYDRLDNFSYKVFSHSSLLATDWDHLLREIPLCRPHT